MVDSIDVLEKWDRLSAAQERRTDRGLREIELHREIRARRPNREPADLIESHDINPLVPADPADKK